MKKFSLLLMIVLIVGAIFVSCSAEPALSSDVATVALSLDTAKELTATFLTESLPGADDLYWYYTAEKTDTGFKTGETNGKTAIRGDSNKGLPDVIGGTGSASNPSASGQWFSTGSWNFCFYGVKAKETSINEVIQYDTSYAEERVIYKAENVALNVARATQANNIGATANIELTVANDTRTGAKFTVTDITVNLGNSYSSGTYTLQVFVDGAQEATKTITNPTASDGVLTFGSNVATEIIAYGKNDSENINKNHELTFKVIKDGVNVPYATETITLNARNGYTWTITGSLANLDAVAWVGIDYTLLSISTEKDLRSLASYVNNGHTLEGKTVKLEHDIVLEDGDWIPIGNSARKDTDGVYFAGTFDGQGYTISGLTLSTETTNLMYDENETDSSAPGISFNEYIFGLFGVVKNATIKNLTLADVDIRSLNRDIDSTHRLTGENVGALIGYSNGSLTVENVTVSSGSVAAGSNVAGIIGRAYGAEDCSISIKNCTNNANITATNGSGNKAKAAGIVGYVSGRGATVTIEGCTNTGALSSTAERNAIAAGIANYGFNNSVIDDYTVKNNTNSGSITLSNNGALYAKISAECNDGKGSGDSISATGNNSTGTVTVGGANVTDNTPLVRSSQNGTEVQN